MLNAWDDPEYTPSPCLACGRTYTPSRLEQKYCEHLCKRAAYEYRKRGDRSKGIVAFTAEYRESETRRRPEVRYHIAMPPLTEGESRETWYEVIGDYETALWKAWSGWESHESDAFLAKQRQVVREAMPRLGAILDYLENHRNTEEEEWDR